MDSTEHPAEAFDAMTYFAQNADLLADLGRAPGNQDQRDAFFAARDEQFAPLDIDWDRLDQGCSTSPMFRATRGRCPNFAESDAANKSLGNKLWTTEGLDVNAELGRPPQDACKPSSTQAN